jgi:HEAT repeat protein
MYWTAYAQSKLGQQADALATLAELTKTYPSSRWIGDAKALDLEVRRSVGQPVRPEAQADEELKLLAIQGLQHSDPAQAVPMLQKFLQGTQSPRLKERALFVLAQSNSPQARQVLAEIAKGATQPDLQRKAIQYLGVNATQDNRQLLAEIYTASTDVSVKRQVLRAYMVAGDRARVVAAATSEPSAELRQEAVRQLGVMGAREELRQLYLKEADVDVKRQILQALFVAGDSTRLVELANSEANAELRLAAVRHLGTMGSQRTGPALVTLYERDGDTAVKRAVVNALFVQGNAESLVALARKESSPELKREMVQKLSLMKSKVATDYLLEILGK